MEAVALHADHSSSSAVTNGFAISSLPSKGDIDVSRVPRATNSPSGRLLVFPASSIAC